jgi:predicted RNase H-like HicB family nuclease
MNQPKYAVVIERGESGGYGAYVPDLPGCIATGGSKEGVERLIAEAIGLHLESLREHGDPIPAPTSLVEYIEPAVA